MVFSAFCAWAPVAWAVGVGTSADLMSAVLACVCVCVCALRGSITVLARSSRLDLYGHTGVLGSGCIPVLPLDQCDMHLGENLARCPRTTLEVGW